MRYGEVQEGGLGPELSLSWQNFYQLDFWWEYKLDLLVIQFILPITLSALIRFNTFGIL